MEKIFEAQLGFTKLNRKFSKWKRILLNDLRLEMPQTILISFFFCPTRTFPLFT